MDGTDIYVTERGPGDWRLVYRTDPGWRESVTVYATRRQAQEARERVLRAWEAMMRQTSLQSGETRT